MLKMELMGYIQKCCRTLTRLQDSHGQLLVLIFTD